VEASCRLEPRTGEGNLLRTPCSDCSWVHAGLPAFSSLCSRSYFVLKYIFVNWNGNEMWSLGYISRLPWLTPFSVSQTSLLEHCSIHWPPIVCSLINYSDTMKMWIPVHPMITSRIISSLLRVFCNKASELNGDLQGAWLCTRRVYNEPQCNTLAKNRSNQMRLS